MSEKVITQRESFYWNKNRPKMDISGQRYGRWLVIERATDCSRGRSRWLCRCDCGREATVVTNNLRSRKSTSCGCYKIERTIETKKFTLTGKRFGRLLVLRESNNKKGGRTTWLCRCDCGREKTIVGKTLTNGATKSCGCLRNERVADVCKKFKSKNDFLRSAISSLSVMFPRIPKCDNPVNINGLVNVSCKMCGKIFTPSRIEIERRINAYVGKVGGENNFYCSESCKNSCSTYGVRSDSVDLQISPSTSTQKHARSCQTKTLKQLQCDHSQGQSYCEKCGDYIDVELHHTLPIAEFGEEAINPAGHMLLCAGCHVNIHAECR